jgi:cytochrome P450
MQNWLPYIRKRYKTGDIFYLDFWPLGPRFLLIADPEISSQFITTGQSLPKSPLETDYVNRFLGEGNMVSAEGGQWKRLRSMFNPGFSASHLMTLVPYIVDASMVFCEVLRGKAETGELFQLEEYATRLTIDIIGKVVLDCDFDSQKGIHPIVDTFRTRVALLPSVSSVYPWANLSLSRPYRLWANERKLNGLIAQELERKIKERIEKKSFRERKKTVIDLALDAHEKEMTANDTNKDFCVTLDANIRRDVVDSMKTFIFAGHDTTASTITYIFYLLHVHPEVYRKLVKELDKVFGVGVEPATIAAAIRNDPYVINMLEYSNAIIKETLRLFPPVSTLRCAPATSDPSKAAYLVDPKTGRQLPISGWQVWPAVHLIARNEEFFPSPSHFIPERFIPSQTPFPEAKLFTPAGKDAWRPFEKGPRNCIGQELAMIESRIILALAVKDFDFVAEYDGVKCDSWTPVETVDEFKDGISGMERRTIEGHRCYQILKGTAKPLDGLPGRISKRKPTAR